jgi:hypothetical protein
MIFDSGAGQLKQYFDQIRHPVVVRVMRETKLDNEKNHHRG